MVRIVDFNGTDDPSTMALTEFPFDAPTVSRSVQNCIIYSNKWTENLSGTVVEKQKWLPDRVRRAGCRGEVRFSLEKRVTRRILQ